RSIEKIERVLSVYVQGKLVNKLGPTQGIDAKMQNIGLCMHGHSSLSAILFFELERVALYHVSKTVVAFTMANIFKLSSFPSMHVVGLVSRRLTSMPTYKQQE
ncbi:hypothetical protein L9F63_022307, partial [Diploptera punctata]